MDDRAYAYHACVPRVRTRQRAMPLAMITMRKSTHIWVSFSFLYEYGAPLIVILYKFRGSVLGGTNPPNPRSTAWPEREIKVLPFARDFWGSLTLVRVRTWGAIIDHQTKRNWPICSGSRTIILIDSSFHRELFDQISKQNVLCLTTAFSQNLILLVH